MIKKYINKKEFIIFFIVLVFLSLSFAIYQYTKELQIQFATAVGTKPSNGHLWSEMECDSAGLCVDSVNGRVGVGVTNPSNKLEVNGDVSSSGSVTATTNVCISSGVCLSDIPNYVASQPLYGLAHTYSMCTSTPDNSGYGELLNMGTTASPIWICQFDANSCPAGMNSQPDWVQYQNWSTTVPTLYQISFCYFWSGIRNRCESTVTCGGCTTGSHAWSNATPEPCQYQGTYTCNINTGMQCCNTGSTTTGYATRSKIGCY